MEKDLFKSAKAYAPSLPFDAADIIVIDEMGKDISGTGLTPRWLAASVCPCWLTSLIVPK
jgi:hypothetical protein